MVCVTTLDLVLITITAVSVMVACGLIIDNMRLKRNKKDPG